MITKISNIQELNKIIRNQIILQSELKPEQVMNGVSIHGQDLLERINQYAYKTYDWDSSFIVFVLESRSSDSNFSQTNEDGTLRIVSSYQVHCYCYGYDSQTLANRIISRLRTEYARLYLQQSGVYLASVSEATSGDDFINDTMMIRTDFFINVSCEMELGQTTNAKSYDGFYIKTEEIQDGKY